MQVKFILGNMTADRAATAMLNDIRAYVQRITDREIDAALAANTVREARFHEGQAALAKDLVDFLDSIEITSHET